MAIDTPARLAVLGAGPVGIEAALYARYLGYDVDVYERGQVGAHLRLAPNLRRFVPWVQCMTTLGCAALSAQEESWSRPALTECPTNGEFLERYLAPLAHSDLIVDGLREQCEVVAVGRQSLFKGEHPDEPVRIGDSFRLLVRDSSGVERLAAADAVIDCTGVDGTHRWLGTGGVPALGERAAASFSFIHYGALDPSEAQSARSAGRRVLVIGAGLAAAASVVSLSGSTPRPQITWLTRRELAPNETPVAEIADDPFPARQALARRANQLAAAGDGVRHVPGVTVSAIELLGAAGPMLVHLIGAREEAIEVDQIVAGVGGRPDYSWISELHVTCSMTSEVPAAMDRLLAAMAAGESTEGLAGAESLLTTEPDYYVLGAKNFGRRTGFTLPVGHAQVRDLFKLIGDRQGLDLYATMPKLTD
ncbi:MAG: FAD-dependent oxidoreductase [Planctomycetes bacterium]|nr:FAD-dependent oxidoreductase [Planctomycetota bacterium]